MDEFTDLRVSIGVSICQSQYEDSLLLRIIWVVYAFIFAFFEDYNSVVAPIQLKSQPGALNGDVVHTTQVYMCRKLLNVDLRVGDLSYKQNQPLQYIYK